jgi:hypothetical protein
MRLILSAVVYLTFPIHLFADDPQVNTLAEDRKALSKTEWQRTDDKEKQKVVLTFLEDEKKPTFQVSLLPPKGNNNEVTRAWSGGVELQEEKTRRSSTTGNGTTESSTSYKTES